MYRKETKFINNITGFKDGLKDLSNPVQKSAKFSAHLINYNQEQDYTCYGDEIFEIITEANNVNNMVPQKLPVYTFDSREINGEYHYKSDGTPLLIREYDSDTIRDYYIKTTDNTKIEKIFEYDKNTLVLRTKIESVSREGCSIKSNITLFDTKINKKYILIQLTQDGTVNNITEFSANGKNFKTIYRSYNSTKVAKYISGKETKENGFVMINCTFDREGNVEKFKKFSNR